MGYGLDDLGLPTEQLLPNRLRGQMLVAIFLNHLDHDTWLPLNIMWHPSGIAVRIIDNDFAEQPY